MATAFATVPDWHYIAIRFWQVNEAVLTLYLQQHHDSVMAVLARDHEATSQYVWEIIEPDTTYAEWARQARVRVSYGDWYLGPAILRILTLYLMFWRQHEDSQPLWDFLAA